MLHTMSDDGQTFSGQNSRKKSRVKACSCSCCALAWAFLAFFDKPFSSFVSPCFWGPKKKPIYQSVRAGIQRNIELQFIERMDTSKNMQNISTIVGKCSIPDRLYLILHESWVEIKYELCMIRLELFLWNTLRTERWAHNLQWPGYLGKSMLILWIFEGSNYPFLFIVLSSNTPSILLDVGLQRCQSALH
jgi:hypothetical protein